MAEYGESKSQDKRLRAQGKPETVRDTQTNDLMPKNAAELAGWLSVEFSVHAWSESLPGAVEMIDAYVARRIQEAETVALQRAAELCSSHASAEESRGPSPKELFASEEIWEEHERWKRTYMFSFREMTKDILALSPDPNWLQRKELDAKIEAANFCQSIAKEHRDPLSPATMEIFIDCMTRQRDALKPKEGAR